MRRAFTLLAYLFAVASLFAEVNTASLDEMAAAHVARLARRDGVIPCSRHETLTNDFGRIRGECVRELGLGVHYLQIRDVDGWLEVRTEDGMLEREVAPVGDRPTTWLWDLFGLSESERAEDYWRLSYLVSRWEIVDDSYVETDASRSSVPFRASARSSTGPEARFTSLKVVNHVITYVAEWDPSLNPVGDVFDLYACTDLKKLDWRRVDVFSTGGTTCHTGSVASASVPGWDAGSRVVHDIDCHIVTNIVTVPFGMAGTYTNVSWSCTHSGVAAKPVFLRFADRADEDGDAIPDCLRAWGQDRDADSDGIPDWWEVWYGLDPFSANTDGDALDAAEELGTVEVLEGDGFLWFDIAEHTNQIRSDAGRDYVFVSSTLSHPFVWRNAEYPAADWYLDGFLHLLPSASWNVWEESFCDPSRDLVFGRDALAEGCVTVAGCNDDMYARRADWGSGMFKGTVVTNGVTYDVFAWLDIGLAASSEGNSPKLSYEVILSSAEPGVVYVSYLTVDEGISARDMALGVQATGVESQIHADEHYALRWPAGLAPRPRPRTTVKYTLGSATDPRDPDTDGDGIPDGFSRVCDFDADGDGLADSVDPDPTTYGGCCYGQSEAWVRASFTNAEEILSVGYTNWVAATVSSGAPNGRCLIRVSVTNAPSQAVLVRVGSLAVVVDGRCELVFPAEVYATYAYECRNADVPVALSCEDGLAPFRGTESLSVTEPTEGHVGTVGVIPVLVVDPPRIAEGSAVGAQLRAAWNVPGASYAWRDQSDTAVFSSPNSNETSVASLDAATTLSVVATDGTHSATGTVAVTATGAVLPERAREPAALGWTTGTNAFGSAIAPDTLRPVWMSVVGDGAAGVAKRNDWTMTVPRGRAVYAAVYGASTEHPDWTRQGSQYNDVLIWNIHADGNRSVSGLERVNSLSESFAASGQNALNGVSPVAFLGGGFYVAPTNDDLTVSVSLVARNIGDGQRESGVAAVFYPLVINQLNHPRAMGVEGTTDDTALPRTNALVQVGGTAYITGGAAAPELFARLNGLPSWLLTRWTGTIVSERPDYRPNGIDTRSLATNDVSGALAFDITAAFTNEVIGGRLDLTARVSNTVERTLPVFIRGKNPKDEVAKAYIDANVDADFRDFAWMIAKHESKQGSRAYNQFNPGAGLSERPFKGNDTITASGTVVTNYGWGMCQIDKGSTGLVARVVYDWHLNVMEMNAKLVSSLETFNRFLGYFRDLYRNDPTTRWYEPDLVTTNLDGRAVSLKEWSVLTFYNGAGGCPRIMLDGRMRRTPLEFDPVSTNWIFHLNTWQYPIRVNADRNRMEVD